MLVLSYITAFQLFHLNTKVIVYVAHHCQRQQRKTNSEISSLNGFVPAVATVLAHFHGVNID